MTQHEGYQGYPTSDSRHYIKWGSGFVEELFPFTKDELDAAVANPDRFGGHVEEPYIVEGNVRTGHTYTTGVNWNVDPWSASEESNI